MKIYVWPCGTWCHFDDIESYPFMSDDYEIIVVSLYYSDHEISLYVHNFLINNA